MPGKFLFSAARYLEELKAHRPKIFDDCMESTENFQADLDFMRIDADKFAASPSESIDYARMEDTSDAVMVPMDAGWSDAGLWASLWEIAEKEGGGNVVSGDAILHATRNTYVRSNDKLIV